MALLNPSLRTALVLLASLLSSSTAIAPSPRNPPPHPLCKAVPGTPNWPSTASWVRLNESTGGRVLRASPPGAVCHPGQPDYNAAGCAAVRDGWKTYEFHQADPVSVDWNQWANDSCLPFDGDPCSHQGYPVFVVNASTARHVKLGVDFAAKHNIRLVVKSSGHDFLGRSVAPNSLSIWVHHLKGIQSHDSFQPKHCPSIINTTAVTVGGGTQMIDLYTTLDEIGQTVVGGGGKTVSVGGYVTGGGHGLLSARYGLAADQVLEAEIVTPTGDIVTANECQNTDLFWAVRGGGGSTFGVLTSATLATYPTPHLTNLQLLIATPSTTPQPTIFAMVSLVLSYFPTLSDAGLSGYTFFSASFPSNSSTLAGGLLSIMVLQDQPPSAMTALWAPVFAAVEAAWPRTFLVLPETTEYPSFYAWFQDYFDTSAAGTNTFVGSRLLGREALAGNVSRNAEVLARFAGGGIGTAYLVSGKGVRDARPRGGGDAVLPAWRRAYVHATFGVDFEPLNRTARTEALSKVNYYLEPMRELAPDSGAYMNEADPEEPDWQHQFWGDNYKRLYVSYCPAAHLLFAPFQPLFSPLPGFRPRADQSRLHIKRKVDPNDVFWCTPCVGNERWQQIGDRLCRKVGNT
ncbi:hypothetical protein B0H67DRAFT_13871 [Lasiosphaeris hirsuta]|uniref:FAD-binding PCMH-type domain-containing protein n=1 Tax=Lasiosphaeris hirsuta TaxID=260670 RepID=A0AA40B915_9PEZI|nr:hypothetical protein B0H67DRAFT_13871 [Lasiosphaeris hirsuta]